ncbi:hypothetical protein NLJ89_g10566 [Agrocybe chaxingu]|uniref:RNA-directed DNA polymerase n=1 Tax=Agrocybe chaxingu TaxID=84603 RepID=A0A9W8JRH6_9AGAR|nr:hypothetical protein NLJ89_g10566 [Agrocybe chaxingu]
MSTLVRVFAPSSQGEATVEAHPQNKTPPILSEGDITPRALFEWERHAEAYFQKASTAEGDKTSAITNCFRGLNVQNWLTMNVGRFTVADVTFKNFMKEMRGRFLSRNWETNILRTIVYSRMPDEELFDNWANRVIFGNNMIQTETRKLKEDELRHILSMHLSEPLAERLEKLKQSDHDRIIGLEDFGEWFKEICALDATIPHDEHLGKRPRTNYIQQPTTTPPNASDSRPPFHNPNASDYRPPFRNARSYNVPASGSNAVAMTGAQSGGGKRPPKLSDEERKILETYRGCKKCRRVNVDHNHTTCPNDWPDANNYRPVTMAMVQEAMKSSTVGATMPSATLFDFMDYTPMASIVELPAAGPSAAAAVLPSLTVNFALGNGTDSGASDNEVSPISVPHLMWKAQVMGRDEFPTPVECMLDCGAHLVLIRPEVVADLGLPKRKLDEPVCVTLALENKKTVVFLDHYVNLSLSSLNNAWTSRPVYAIIAPGLCTNILLGLPFLTHNKIVCDYEKRTAINKDTLFDLLNETRVIPERKPPKKSYSPRKVRKAIFDTRKEVMEELSFVLQSVRAKVDAHSVIKPMNIVGAIKSTIENLAEKERLGCIEKEIKHEFRKVFEPIPHADELPTTETARIQLKDAYKVISTRRYNCPRQFQEAFRKLIQQRLDSGFIRLSSSEYASPSFIIPKADKNALPRWVCDYRALNANTIPDNFPLPRVEDILADCARGRIWAVIDMTDSFFQTRMHPDDIHKTAVTTPMGTYEWMVMPMGFRNAPAIHQRRVTNALHGLIGKICHVYIDDIVIWSDTIEEHIRNVRKVMKALQDAKLYVNEKKTKLFCHEIKFLGHKISRKGIEADGSKVEKILDWPKPKNSSDVRQFLGLVRYLNAFLPKLALHSHTLEKLTMKACEKNFPRWNDEHQSAFENIKRIVVSRECLTVIDHTKLDENKIFLTTDASDHASGAVLSFGPTWETARPVAFDSKTFKDAELNYPVHEKELLAILRGIRKWKVDLLGAPFYVYTDHKTLLNFNTQKDLSRRQARWMEELSIYDCKFVYVKGEDNSVADALSRFPLSFVPSPETAEQAAGHPYNDPRAESTTVLVHNKVAQTPLATIGALTSLVGTDKAKPTEMRTSISLDPDMVDRLRKGYLTDSWCQKLISAPRA